MGTMKNQGDIAKQIGISGGFLSLILSGRARPSWSTAKRLAEITATDPAFWMEAKAEDLRRVVDQVRVRK